MTDRGYMGFLARGFRSGVEARRLARRAERGAPACFFLPHDPRSAPREVLWCSLDSPAADRLRQLAREASQGD